MRNEKTVTLPINQNKQRHQSSLRKSRTNESHQISSKFLPQLGFISMFDSSSRLLSRGSGASPSAAKVVGEQVVVHSRKCFAAWNWSADDYLVQQPTRGLWIFWLCKLIGSLRLKCTKNTWSNISSFFFLSFFQAKKNMSQRGTWKRPC